MKIVAGGQTGVDMAALQFAQGFRIPYGGWVPKGRMNEAGRIPDHFIGLKETTVIGRRRANQTETSGGQ